MPENPTPEKKPSLELGDVIGELVVLAIVVGAIPELFIGGLRDAFGACGFGPDVCKSYIAQGLWQAAGGVICVSIAMWIAFKLYLRKRDR